MHHLFTLLFCALTCAACAQPAGYQIRIKTENIQADSLFIKAYNAKSKSFTKFQAFNFTNDITLKGKASLPAGIYVVEADSIMLTEFLISDAKNQKFTISFLNDDIKIDGSKENIANLAYIKQMSEFHRREMVLGERFRQMQQQRLPDYMLQTFADSLFKQFDKIYAERSAFQEKMINENKGLLLASIIQASIDAPQPPKEYYQDRARLAAYLAEHHFDNFPWEDERLLATPVLQGKFKRFAQQIFQLDAKASIPIVLKVFNESKKNRNMYYAFFDFLEHDFGSYRSPYRDEPLAIAMLKDILSISDLEETRRLRYEYELNLIDKNHAGQPAIDFNILLANGDTTNLYAVDAEFLMIYFQLPDCPTCVELRGKMKDMAIVNNAIAVGKLKILTIYFEDNEDLWRNYLKTRALQNWTHGWNYDLQISEKRLYDIRNIPMIMFLDKNKKVIKKDLLSNEMEEWLKRYL